MVGGHSIRWGRDIVLCRRGSRGEGPVMCREDDFIRVQGGSRPLYRNSQVVGMGQVPCLWDGNSVLQQCGEDDPVVCSRRKQSWKAIEQM